MSDQEGKRYEAQDGTTFDTRYRGQDVDLHIAADNTVIANPRASVHAEQTTSEEEE